MHSAIARGSEKFIKKIIHAPDIINSSSKISIFGCNDCSVQILASLIMQEISADICFFDESQTKLDVNVSDFLYFKFVLHNLNFNYSTDIRTTANSDICLLCFESEKYCINRRVEICLKTIRLYQKHIGNIVKYSPNSILIVCTFPYSIITYYCWKFSQFPEHRVFGLGLTNWSIVFWRELSRYFQVSVRNVNGWVIGTSVIAEDDVTYKKYFVPLWSTVSAGGIKVRQLIEIYGKNINNELSKIIQNIIMEYDEALHRTGRPVLIISGVVNSICESILTNSQRMFSVSTNIRGSYDVNFVSFIGIPCLIGRKGIDCNVNLKLHQSEIESIRKVAKISAFNVASMDKILLVDESNKYV